MLHAHTKAHKLAHCARECVCVFVCVSLKMVAEHGSEYKRQSEHSLCHRASKYVSKYLMDTIVSRSPSYCAASTRVTTFLLLPQKNKIILLTNDLVASSLRSLRIRLLSIAP